MNKRSAFSLVELLVVIGIVALLIGILLPTLRKAKMAAQQTVCASNLRQFGAGLLLYVNDHDQRLPFVVEPYWNSNGSLDLTRDPTDSAFPDSFAVVMKKYVTDGKILVCPGANLGFPEVDPKMTYRVSAANNVDGRIWTNEQLLSGPFGVNYNYSLKYLNGRRYELLHVNPFSFRLEKGAGSHYLIRDMVRRRLAHEPVPATAASSVGVPPHPNRQYNQLRLDMSVTLERDTRFDVSTP
jgi:type II secretory pathway pseudopilin PulG